MFGLMARYSICRNIAANPALEVQQCLHPPPIEFAKTPLRLARARRYEIDQRLAELAEEWDIERYLETMAPTFTLLGTFLGLTKSRKFFVIPIVVQAFFLQHALQGWCPPLIPLRRLGIRTADAINKERYALKALRGDFEDVNANNVMAAVEE
jgi:hypothetical protein